jgi:hypothetical protein
MYNLLSATIIRYIYGNEIKASERGGKWRAGDVE